MEIGIIAVAAIIAAGVIAGLGFIAVRAERRACFEQKLRLGAQADVDALQRRLAELRPDAALGRDVRAQRAAALEKANVANRKRRAATTK